MTLVIRVALGQNGMGGGRCLRTGICPNWAVPPHGALHGGRVVVVGGEEITPGSSGTVEVTPLDPPSWVQVVVGDTVEVRLGGRPYGVGRVEAVHAVNL